MEVYEEMVTLRESEGERFISTPPENDSEQLDGLVARAGNTGEEREACEASPPGEETLDSCLSGEWFDVLQG